MAEWTGRQIDKVQIGDLIARGGMAEIYLGQHIIYGQVAVKVLRGLLEHDASQLARFQREAEVIGELKHPNIVQLKDYIVYDETPCLIMEYIQGPSLANYMKGLHDRRQRIPIAVVANILRQVASALDYAHSNGIVHRDIKPANVLLRSPTQLINVDSNLPMDVEPILTDFGLVRLMDSTMHTTTGSVSGTPAYMSPEQARGDKVDYRTDIYSLGIMLYEMLSGSVPFLSDTTFGMLMKHINETPPPIKGLSLEMYALLERALAKDPLLRYQSAGALANEFMALFNGETISPGTLEMAELARNLAQKGGFKNEQPPSLQARWGRLAFEILLGAGLLGAITYAFFIRNPVAAGTATLAAVNSDTPAGRLRFDDFSQVVPMDKVTLSLNNVVAPPQSTHYEGWLVSNNGATTRKIGKVALNDALVGQIILTSPDQEDFFQNFNKVIVTAESDNGEVNKPTGKIAYSSVFPPQALIPIRVLDVTDDTLPEKLALIWGFWYYSGDYVNLSISGDKDSKIVGLKEAYDNKDEATVRARTEEIINQIVGNQSDQFLDYNKDGTIDNTPGDLSTDGYGSFPNGSQKGYIKETLEQTKLAADAPDATPNIRTNSNNLQICVQNTDDRLKLILQSALKLNDTPFGSEMQPIIADLESLGDRLVHGNDANNNGLVEPLAGECGTTDAYTFSYLMADMSLYPGENRMPPTK